MALVWNVQTGKLENAPDEALTQGVAGGQYAFRKGARLPVITPDGAMATIAAEDAQSAFSNGYRYLTRAESDQRFKAGVQAAREEAFAKPVTAFGAGLVRGATLGLSDVAARGLEEVGVVPEGATEGLRTLAEVQPGATLGGEIVGGIASLATPLAPAGAVARLGAGVTRAVESTQLAQQLAQAGRVGQIVSRLGAAGAGSAVEGLFLGTGQVASEAALGDPNLTAGSALGTIGLSGALGAGLGVVGRGVGEAWNALKSQMGGPAGVTSKAYGKVASLFRGLEGEEKKQFESVFQDAGRMEQLAHHMSHPDELYKKGFDVVRTLTDVSKAETEMLGALRAKAQADGTMLKFLSASEKEAGLKVGEAIGNALEEVRKRPARYKGGIESELDETLATFVDNMSKARTRADQHIAIQDTRQVFDRMNKLLGKEPSKEAMESKALLDKVRSAMKNHLVDENVYGGFAKEYAEANGAFTKYYTAARNIEKKLYSKYATTEGEKSLLDPAKIERWLKNPEKAELSQRAVDAFAESLDEMGAVSSKLVSVPEYATVVAETVGGLKSQLQSLKDLRLAARAVTQAESFTGKSLTPAVVGGLAAQGAVGWLDEDAGIGARGLAGVAGAAIANPRLMVRYLAALERRQAQTLQLMDAAVGKFAGRTGLAEPQIATRAGLRAMVSELVPEWTGDHLEAAKQVLEINPEQIDERLTRANPWLDQSAPATYAAMHHQATRGIEFLKSKFADLNTGDAVFPTKPRLSGFEKKKFEMYAHAVDNPLELVRQLGANNVHPETVEAVQVVYPDLYNELKKRLVNAVIEQGKELPYTKRRTLMKTFGIPSSPSLANIPSLQMSYLQTSADEQADMSQKDRMEVNHEMTLSGSAALEKRRG